MPSKPEWESRKDDIRDLYLYQNYTLKALREHMKSTGFIATKSQYETKFKAWGFSKNDSNIPATIWKHVGYKVAKRKRENEDSAVCIDGAEVDSKRFKKEISRHTYSTIEQIELESIGAPSPPGLLAIVSTPSSSQTIFSVNHWPSDLPWLAFVRSLNACLVSLHQANKITRASRHYLSASGSRAQHGVVTHKHNVSALGVWQKSRHITTGRERRDLIRTILPVSSTNQGGIGVQQSMSLLSTTSSHWVLKLLIYLASNSFLETGELGDIWYLMVESGVKQLATLSQTLYLGELSLKAALEYLFEAGVRECHTGIVSWLLEIGVDPNRRIRSHRMDRLHLPVCILMAHWKRFNANSIMYEYERTKVKSMVSLLLSRGASPLSRCCGEHKTAAHLAITNPEVDGETLELILQHFTSSKDPKDYFQELGTNVENCEAHQNPDEVLLKMEALVELLEKSSTSRETLVSPETLIQAVGCNNDRLVRIIHRRGLSMNSHGFGSLFPLAVAVTGQGRESDSVGTNIAGLLLKLGASPNYNPHPDKINSCSPALQAAVHCIHPHNRARFVQLLIGNGAKVQGSVSCDHMNHRSLMDCALSEDFATYRGPYVEVLKALHGAGLPFPGDSLLRYAETFSNYHYEFVSESFELLQLLISATADWTLKSERGWTALDYMTKVGMNEVEELMAKKGATHSRKFMSYYCRTYTARFDRLDKLFQRVPIPRNDKQKRTWLFYRIISNLHTTGLGEGRMEAMLIMNLLHDYSKLPRSPKHEAYIIYRACTTGNISLVGLILNLFPGACSPAALRVLIRCQTDEKVDYWYLIEELLRRHLINSSSLQWSQGMKIFSQAVYDALISKGDPRVLLWFYENGMEAFRLANFHPSSFLMKCVTRKHTSGSQGVPTALLYHGSWSCRKGLNTVQFFRYGLRASTYLGLLVAHVGDIDQMAFLLQFGLRPNRRFAWASTILQTVVAMGKLVMSRQLLDAGADVNGRAPWRNIPKSIHHRFGGGICAGCNAYIGPRRARSALQWAVQTGKRSLITLLLEYGANVNEPPAPFGGATALQIASIQGSLDIAGLLLQNGANVNAAGARYSGRTALEGAAELGRLDMVCFLLERGCLVHDSFRVQYIRAVGFARAEAHDTVAMKLQEHGSWTVDDENVLKDINLTDRDLSDCSSEDLPQDDEEISEVDFSESDEDCRYSFPLETDSESEFGEDDPISDGGKAPISAEYMPHGTVSERGSSETDLGPATLQHDIWDELIEYYGDDEGVEYGWEGF